MAFDLSTWGRGTTHGSNHPTGKYEIVAQSRVMMKRHTPLRRTQRSSELWPRREVSKGSWGADKEAEI